MRSHLLLAGMLVVPVTAVVLAAAAWGASPGRHSTPPGGEEQALAFSACMRVHGMPSFPKPITLGGKPALEVKDGSELDPRSPAYRGAFGACRNELPAKLRGGFAGS